MNADLSKPSPALRALADNWKAVRAAVPTMHHAVQLVDAVAARLGHRGWRDPRIERPVGAVHVVDATTGWVVAQPLVFLRFNITVAAPPGFTVAVHTVDKDGTVRAAPEAVGEPPPPPPAMPLLPKGPEMRGGLLLITEGALTATLTFDDQGVLRPLPAPVADRWTVEELAEKLVGLESVGRSKVRVRIPDSSPELPVGAHRRAMTRLRELFADSSWGGGRFVVVDGWDGAAVEVGDEARTTIAAWEQALFRHKPQPPKPPPPPPKAPDPPPGAFTISIGGDSSGPKWPPATPRNVPGVLFELPSLDREIPGPFQLLGFTRWMRIVGEATGPALALVRDESDGMTIVGEDALAIAAPSEVARFEELLALKLDEWRSYDAQLGQPCPWDDSDNLAFYVPRDDGTLAWAGGSVAHGLGPQNFDADQLVARVSRLRRVQPSSGRWPAGEGVVGAVRG